MIIVHNTLPSQSIERLRITRTMRLAVLKIGDNSPEKGNHLRLGRQLLLEMYHNSTEDPGKTTMKASYPITICLDPANPELCGGLPRDRILGFVCSHIRLKYVSQDGCRNFSYCLNRKRPRTPRPKPCKPQACP